MQWCLPTVASSTVLVMATQAQRGEGEAAAEVVLMRGRYAGTANTALELHGVPVVLRGLDGASDINM